MERVRRLLSRAKEKFVDERDWWEKMIDDADKEAKRLERKFQFSYRLGLTPQESRFFVECGLAREIALRRERERKEHLDKKDAERVRRGHPIGAVKELRRLRLQPVRRPSQVIGDRSVNMTAESFFDYAYIFDYISHSFLPEELGFEEAKRGLLETIFATVHLVYSLVAEDEGEPKRIIPTCEAQRNKILAARERMVVFLKDPSLYGDAFLGMKDNRSTFIARGVKRPPSYLKLSQIFP